MRIFAPKVSKLTFAAGADPADSAFTGSFTGSLIGSLTAQEDIYTTAQAGFTGLQSSISGSFAGSGSAHTQRGALVSTLSGSAHTDRIAKVGVLSGSAHTDRIAKVGVLSGSAHTQRAALNTAQTSANTTLSSSLDTRIKVNEGFKTNFDTAISLSSDDVTVLGDLTVQGATTTLNTATLDVEDLNITVAKNAADSSAANGAGLTVDGADATFTYTHSGTKWNLNKDLDLGSNNLLTSGNVDGRDVSADGTKLDTIEESADVTDTTNVTAAGALMSSSLGATINNNVVKLAGIETGATADQTLADLSLDTSDDVQFDSFGVGTAASGTTGEIRATGDITAYYSSDERLKENFTPLAGALDKVKAIGGYEFDWKDGIEDVVSKKGHDIGVKAQELQAQYPDLVHERDNGYLAVDYIKLNAVLIEAVKELAAKVEELSK